MTRLRRPRLPAFLTLLTLLALSGCESEGPDKNTTAPATLVFAGDRLPLGLLGATYGETLGVTGGRTPYVFAFDAADLPAGLADQSTATAFGLGGVPTAAGTFTIPLTVTDADKATASTVVTVVVAGSFDPVGGWSYHTLVTVANGGCDGEEGDETTYGVTITRTGTAVTLKGLLGDDANQVAGTWNGNRLTLTGTYPEDGGFTTGTHNLVVYTPNLMSGLEDWDWGPIAGASTCPVSVSRITATRTP
ncbi:hypothetical protein KDM41_00530 [bacterium]|nr:hypothetical protein [bacterium]